MLERDGLVSRAITTAVPVKVEYGLTPIGRRFRTVQAELLRLGQETIGDIRAACAEYDEQAKAAAQLRA